MAGKNQFSDVSDAELNESHLLSVVKALYEAGVLNRVRYIGTQLGVHHQLCNRYQHDPDKALYCVMGGWLRKQFDEKYKNNSPSWRALVIAVKSKVGGNSGAGAKRIVDNCQDYMKDDNGSTYSEADATTLTVHDEARVVGDLQDVSSRWYQIGVALGLSTNTLDGLQDLQDMIHEWLNNGDDPCWRRLLIAIAAPYGGGNPALANKLLDRSNAPHEASEAHSQGQRRGWKTLAIILTVVAGAAAIGTYYILQRDVHPPDPTGDICLPAQPGDVHSPDSPGGQQENIPLPESPGNMYPPGPLKDVHPPGSPGDIHSPDPPGPPGDIHSPDPPGPPGDIHSPDPPGSPGDTHSPDPPGPPGDIHPPGEKWRGMEPQEDMLLHIKYTDPEGKEQHFHLIEKIQNNCRNLGTILGIEQETLNGFDSKHRGDMSGFCQTVLHTWITRAQGKYPVTWGGLLEALRHIQLGGIVMKLEKALNDSTTNN